MAHVIIITTPPSAGGGGSRVAHEHGVKVTVEYSPEHGLTPDREHVNIRKIERASAKLYDKLQVILADPGEDAE